MLILVLLFALSLPIAILFESKKRLERPSWGWALFSGFVLLAVFGQINRELLAAGASDPASIEQEEQNEKEEDRALETSNSDLCRDASGRIG
jgi:hypothetical protein